MAPATNSHLESYRRPGLFHQVALGFLNREQNEIEKKTHVLLRRSIRLRSTKSVRACRTLRFDDARSVAPGADNRNARPRSNLFPHSIPRLRPAAGLRCR